MKRLLVLDWNKKLFASIVHGGWSLFGSKPTFLFRDDFRRCTDSERYPLNLMIFTGLPEAEWEDWFYTSLDELSDPDKALARWLTA